MKMTKFLRGFTLIELLIVVAIIAILAAIAVPNFLEAQVRARISRNRADMRSLATAIESYAVDNNVYPWPSDPFGVTEGNPGATEWFETKVPNSITTPIAYITTRFPDPFHPPDSADEDPVYHLMTRAYAASQNGADDFFAYAAAVGVNNSALKYILLGHGPDLDHDSPDLTENPEGPALYDPTNGTISNGDILYFGPGIGFGPR
jgi:prepilin-type N-terminal cleavage/methylation domain-containing protein